LPVSNANPVANMEAPLDAMKFLLAPRAPTGPVQE
jgi:hypothetical protein